MKELRKWSLRKKLVVGFLVVMGLVLAIPWPLGVKIIGADEYCEPTEPPSCRIGEWKYVVRKPLINIAYRRLVGNNINDNYWYIESRLLYHLPLIQPSNN